MKPELSVIVPVRNGADVLPDCLTAIASSDLPPDRWELLVVDDGSVDGSGRLAARWANRVLRVLNGPKGPAFARNYGASRAFGDILLFIDADVVVHEDTLSRVLDVFEEDPAADAVFGTYDDKPSHPAFLSQYRNLLHSYIHLRGAGEAESFWAGCGAVRMEAFAQIGGFDAGAFPTPQIEDIEFGYRLRAEGRRIVLRPEVQAKHAKRWTFGEMLRTDLVDRGLPWARLLLSRPLPGSSRRILNIGPLERAKVVLVSLAVIFGIGGLPAADSRWGLLSLACLFGVVGLGLPFYRWLAARRGWWFAVRAVPIQLLHHLVSALAAALAVGEHLFGRLSVFRSVREGRSRV